MLTILTLHAALVLTCPADTGAVPNGALTPAVIDTYVAVDVPLSAYWEAHPDRKKAALSQATSAEKFQIPEGSIVTSPIIDYTQLVKQDTAIATIFTRAHVTPDQFGMTQMIVQRTIWGVLLKQTVDSNTVTGQNMKLVQAHRAQLATEFTRLQDQLSTTEDVDSFIKNAFNSQRKQSDQSDLPR